MIDADLYKDIRRLRIEGLTQRRIAAKLGVSRKTVAKYCAGGHIPGMGDDGRTPKEPADKAAIKDAIRKYCEANQDNQTDKHKINGHTLWRDLHREFPRHEATYRRYWAEIRGERQVQTRLPLAFSRGEAAEIDWKMAKIRVRGVSVKIHVLCVNLMYSYAPFKKAYPKYSVFLCITIFFNIIDENI